VRAVRTDCASAMKRLFSGLVGGVLRFNRRARLQPAPVCVAIALLAAAAVCSLSAVGGPAHAQRPEASPGVRVTQGAAERRALRLRLVRNWGYWLSSFDIGEVVDAPHDLMVVDNGVSANHRFLRERSAEEVARMKRRPDGSARILLSYLSIGEAERYRAYWRPEWYDRSKKPPWLGDVNPDWDGNYFVQYWQPAWQALIFGSPESYLDTIMAQGFDGVYLDRADAFLNWDKARPTAEADMVDFLRRLTDYARQRNPDFLVVMQNAEELLDNPQVLDGIDGIAKEDLYFGVDRPEAPNNPKDVAFSLKQLRMARDVGRKVLVVEYLSDPVKLTATAKRIVDNGFVPYFAPRLLNCLNPPAVPLPALPLPCR
jgi:cysteinyl-tRNA synthetase, unknown class